MRQKTILALALLTALPFGQALASDNAAPVASDDCSSSFAARFAAAYREDAAPVDPNAAPAPAVARRAMASPLASLPFPSAEWQLGGVTYPIGVPNLNTRYPLEKALSCTGVGRWLDDNRLEAYGWINPSSNLSSSNTTNYPLSYATRPNRVELSQALFRIERVVDTVQTDHVDWGVHLDLLYGYDYHYTTMKGVFSNQYLNNHPSDQPQQGKSYGVDPMLFYGDIYFPSVAEGMVVRIGRYLSMPDIEAQFSPNNYLLTHSILYTTDPYTQMGVMTTTRLSAQWTVQLGLQGSNDVAVWNSEARPSLTACVRWVSKSNNDMLYPCINNWNTKDYNYNNIQMAVMTWGHRFNDDVHILTEAYRIYGRNIPGFGPDMTPGVTGSSALPGTAAAFAFVNYFNVQLSPSNMLSFRNEFYNDQKGQRTGYATRYTSHTLGMTHWVSQDVELRPEVRYEKSYDLAAYDAGKKDNQLTALLDVILHY